MRRIPRLSPPAANGLAPYLVAAALTSAALLIRWALHPWLGSNVAYLQFFPALMLAAWYGGMGPGLLATGLSTVAAMYFFLAPDGFGVTDAADLISLTLFVVTGLAIAALNQQLRTAQLAQHAATALATARAERLDAIISTTVDAIIVIDARGRIEAFNRGASGITYALIPAPSRMLHTRPPP